MSLESADLYKHTRRADVVVEEGNKVGGGEVGRVLKNVDAGIDVLTCINIDIHLSQINSTWRYLTPWTALPTWTPPSLSAPSSACA